MRLLPTLEALLRCVETSLMRWKVASWMRVALVLTSAVVNATSQSLPAQLMHILEQGCHAARNLMIDVWSLRNARSDNSTALLHSADTINASWQIQRSTRICRRLSLRFADNSSTAKSKFEISEAQAVLHAALIASHAFPLHQQRQLQTLNRYELLKNQGDCFAWANQAPDRSRLQHGVEAFLASQQPPHAATSAREAVLSMISERCKQCFGADCNLEIVGSIGTGMGSVTSDVDVVLVLNRTLASANETRQVAKTLAQVLGKQPAFTAFAVLKTRVPVVKFRCQEQQFTISGDISINNAVAVQHTALIRSYSEAHPQLALLVGIVKLWAAQRHLIGAKHAGVTSFGLLVMVLFILERFSSRLLPRLLPNTFDQSIIGHPSAPHVQIHPGKPAASATQEHDTQPDKGGGSKNANDLADEEEEACGWMVLLERFFWFFGVELQEEEYPGSVISARHACVARVSHHKDRSLGLQGPQPMFVESEGAKRNTGDARDSRSSGSSAQRTAAMTVEDPLDPASNLARHVTAASLATLQLEMARAYTLLRSGAPLSCLLAPLPAQPRGQKRADRRQQQRKPQSGTGRAPS